VRGPIDRMTERVPDPWRSVLDWVLTIAIAIGVVLAIKAWVVNPYRIPSSSMEPTLHCAKPADGCRASLSDRVLANRFIYHFKDPERGDVIVFKTPPEAEKCQFGTGGGSTFVKRIVGLPGEKIRGQNGFVYIDGKKLDEPYLDGVRDRRDFPEQQIPADNYFMMGDNRGQSCDSRDWGTVPGANIIGEVFAVYWPPRRIGFR
jgi:signal peptidase I